MAKANRDNLTLVKPSHLTHDVTAFLIAKQAQGVSPRYLDFLRDELRFFGEFLADKGVDAVESVTATHIRQYLIKLGERRNAGGCHCAFRAITDRNTVFLNFDRLWCIISGMDEKRSHEAKDWKEGRRLRAWELYQAGWKQVAIAEALGVTPGAVSQWLK